MKQMTFLRSMGLLALLTASLVTLAACTDRQEEPATLDPTLFANDLDLSHLPPDILADATQVLDRTMEENGVTVILHQAYGDPLALHTVYTVVLPEGTDPEGLLPGEVYLEDGETYASLPDASRTITAKPQEDGTLLCLTSFTFDKEILQPGIVLAFTVEDLMRGETVAIETTLTFQFTLETDGPVQYLDIKNADGEMVGTCLFSAFALNASLWDWEPPADAPGPGLPPVKLLDADGNEIETNASTGGGGFNTRLTFRTVLDPDTVAAVQVGDYVTEVP